MPVISLPPVKAEDPDNNLDDELYDDFEDSSEDGLIIHYNILSILPNEYALALEASEDEDEAMCEESVGQKPLCYYVMNNEVVEEQ